MWSIHFIFKLLPWCILGMLLVMFLFSCIYTVFPEQQGLLYRFGVLQTTLEPGIHLKLPYPIDTVEIYDVNRVKNLYIGYEPGQSKDYLWTSAHGGNEYTLLSGNGNELIAVNILLNYRINDLKAYRINHKSPEDMLSAKAYAYLTQYTSASNLDTLLSVDRTELSQSINDELNRYSEEAELGLEVLSVVIENIHPAVETATAYQNVVNANIYKSTVVIQAEGYTTQVLNNAQRERQTLINQANANQLEKVSSANSSFAVLNAAFEAYELSPDSLMLTKLLDAYRNVINGSRLYVFSPGTFGNLDRFVLPGMATNVFVE